MRSRSKLGLAGLGIATLAIAGTVAPAFADPQAQANDAVLVGSDTLQFGTDFVADGDPTGDAGYNAGATNRVVDYFATGDANGRFTVAGGVSGAPGSAGETAILRAGTAPVLRPNGSGKGVAALIADAPGNTGYDGLATGSIQFARMSRLPTKTVSSGTSEDAACDALAGCGGLHVYEIADDTLGLATSKAVTTNAVGLDANQLWNIYNCTNDPTNGDYTHWNSAKIGGTSGDTIIPVIPQSGSGSRVFFLATIDAASGHTSDPSLGSCVKTAQEHDPTGITGQANPADAIEPFSAARLTLINSGYFNNSSGTKGTPASGYAPQTLQLETGTSAVDTTTPVFSTVRAVYLTIRQADLAATCSATSTPACFVPGGTQTAIQALLTGGRNATFRSSAFKSDLQAAGFTAKFQDCGVDPDDSATSNNTCVTAP